MNDRVGLMLQLKWYTRNRGVKLMRWNENVSLFLEVAWSIRMINGIRDTLEPNKLSTRHLTTH